MRKRKRPLKPPIFLKGTSVKGVPFCFKESECLNEFKGKGVWYMAKEWAKSFYNSKAWQECRTAYIKTVDGLCETCKENGIIKPGYILHHKEHLTPSNINDPMITLNWDNLKYECKECHDKHEGHGVAKPAEVIREGLMFDSNGDVVPIKE